MPELSRDQLRDHVRRREFSPVYLLYGEERYLRDLAAATIADRAFGEGDLRDFNETTFELNSADDLPRAIAACQQLPMMSERRVVRINGVKIFATGNRDTVREEHESLLRSYFADPSGQTILIFAADELNGNRKMSKLLKASAQCVEFNAMQDGDLRNWAMDKFRADGIEIAPQTVAHLIDLTGSELRRVAAEVEKITVAALGTKKVTDDLIDQLISNEREISNFDLTEKLNAGDSRSAMATLRKVLDDGAEPLMILGLLSYNYRRLLMAKDMMARSVERRDIERSLGLRYGQQDKFMAAVRRATMSGLQAAIRHIAETDLAIKTSIGGGGPKGGRMQIEVLVCRLAAGV